MSPARSSTARSPPPASRRRSAGRRNLSVENGVASLSLTDADGAIVEIGEASLDLRSPAGDLRDRTVELARAGDGFDAPLGVADGLWVVAIRVRTADGRDWLDTRRIVLRGGTLQ